jgi:hypothetical protein
MQVGSKFDNGMKDRELTETQIENLVELVHELEGKLKKKNLQLTVLHGRLNNAKLTIKRLQGIISYQRDRIVKLYKNDVVDLEPGIVAKRDRRT